MNRLPEPCAPRQSGPSAAWLVALVLVFWTAQMHGLAHGVSHLGDRAVPHALVCADCVAAANAGAAPPTALPAPALPAVAAQGGVETAAPAHTQTLVPVYRSRAPPTTLS